MMCLSLQDHYMKVSQLEVAILTPISTLTSYGLTIQLNGFTHPSIDILQAPPNYCITFDRSKLHRCRELLHNLGPQPMENVGHTSQVVLTHALIIQLCDWHR